MFAGIGKGPILENVKDVLWKETEEGSGLESLGNAIKGKKMVIGNRNVSIFF